MTNPKAWNRASPIDVTVPPPINSALLRLTLLTSSSVSQWGGEEENERAEDEDRWLKDGTGEKNGDERDLKV